MRPGPKELDQLYCFILDEGFCDLEEVFSHLVILALIVERLAVGSDQTGMVAELGIALPRGRIEAALQPLLELLSAQRHRTLENRKEKPFPESSHSFTHPLSNPKLT